MNPTIAQRTAFLFAYEVADRRLMRAFALNKAHSGERSENSE